jgi:hypothetical protein
MSNKKYTKFGRMPKRRFTILNGHLQENRNACKNGSLMVK